MTANSVLAYQQKVVSEYCREIGLPVDYSYPDGNPIRALPPVQTALGHLMIVGAYPSARFESRRTAAGTGRNRLVPIADNLHPFSAELYFDGQRVRRLESAHGLRHYLLEPLCLLRDACWITDLVKVFLYKPEHLDACRAVAPGFSPIELRSRYLDLAQASLKWLRDEVVLARPRLIVTLGHEVAQSVSGNVTASAQELLTSPVQFPASLDGLPAIYMPHPDACRRMEKWRDIMLSRTRLARVHLETRES